MKIKLNYTEFRKVIRSLSVYSEKGRSDTINAKIKWSINEDIRIFGYQQPDYQTRLTAIKLNQKGSRISNRDCPDFLTEVPNIRGLGTAVGNKKITIDMEAENDYLTIHTDDFRYNVEKIRGSPDLHIVKNYLPMNDVKIQASIPISRFKKFVHNAQTGPLRLYISNDSIKFVSKNELEEDSWDITKFASTQPNNKYKEYLYDIYLLGEILKKFPQKNKIKLFVNDNLIRLQYEIGDNFGQINYYQRGRDNTT